MRALGSRRFVQLAYRRAVTPAEETRFLPVIQHALKTGSSFAEAMVTGYTAVLSSPGFLYLQDRPGPLEDRALAERLSYFLWNSPPDPELRRLAAEGKLRDPAVRRTAIASVARYACDLGAVPLEARDSAYLRSLFAIRRSR